MRRRKLVHAGIATLLLFVAMPWSLADEGVGTPGEPGEPGDPGDPTPVINRYCDTGDWEILNSCNPANAGQPCFQTKKKKNSECKFTDDDTACVDYGIVTNPKYKRLGECMSNGVCRELQGSTWVEDGSNQIRSCATIDAPEPIEPGP